MERKSMKKTLRSIKNRVAIILALTMMICDCVPAAAYALDNEVLISEDIGTSDVTSGALEGADEVASEQMVPDEEGNKSSNLLKEDAPVLEDGETLLTEEGILTEGDDKTVKAETDDKESLQPEGSPEKEDAEELKPEEPEAAENEGIGAEGAYDLNAVLLKATQEYSYPGVYTVKLVSENAPDKDFETIGVPSISNVTLEKTPTNESPAIIMGAALPYEEKTGPTEFTQIPGGKLYAPYSYFRYEIIEEANPDGKGGTHRKMSGFDGTYVIIRVDVSDILKDAPDGSYLHVKQSNNKALMVKIGQESKNGCVTFADACGSKTGSYLISGNNLVTKDEDGAYQDVSYIDVIFLSSGTLVQGADTGGSTPDPKAPLADFPLSFYIDETEDYDPGIEWNSSLATAVDKETGKAITLTPEETQAGITTTDKLLAKYYDEEKAATAEATVRRYKVMGSDIELEEMVENESGATTETGKTEYWSLRKAMEYEKYNNHAIKLICEAPLLNSINVTAGPGITGRHVILDVNSFDIQLANHQETGAAALTVDNAALTIQDTFNTTGAELAVGNNAQMLITNNGRLIIADSAQLEVEYDAASVSAGSVPEKKLVNGVITVNKGGVIENHGIITVEGREGKPQTPGTVVRDYSSARLTIDEGGTLENSGCVLVNGDLFNFGTIKNTGKYSDEITSYDPDKGTFTYHKGIQLSWKDDITQGQTYCGELFNGVEYIEDGQIIHSGARFINEGDFVMIPGWLDNYATITNSGNIYMSAVDEIVVPIMAYSDNPVVTEQRIKLGKFENSIFINHNYTQGSGVIENSGNITTAEIEIVSNGRTGKIIAEESRNKKDLVIESFGKVTNTGKIAVGGLYAYSDVTNDGIGVVERVILAQNNDPLTTGTFTDSGTSGASKVYNGSKGSDGVWRYTPIGDLKVSEATRIQEANPGETVKWVLGAESSTDNTDVTYSVRLREPEPYREIGIYDVAAGQDVEITSEALPDVKGNVVYEFEAEQAAMERDNSAVSVAVKMKGDGFIKPTPVQDLVYNGKKQELVSPGSMEDKNVLYRLGESGEYSTEIPGATDAGQYTVYYMVEGENDQFSGSVIAVIAKKDAYIAADNLVSKKGDARKDLTYIAEGIVSGDNIGLSLLCNGLDMTTAGTYTIEADYLPTQAKNYNVKTYNGTYTVLDTEVNISAQVQAVLVPFDNAGHNISINLVYKPEVTSNTSEMYYSLSDNLTKENYKEKGTTVAPACGSIGEQVIYYYVHTPENADFSGSRPVVITKAEQKAPEKLTGEADFKGRGGVIKGLVPFNSERIPMEYRRADEDSYTRAVNEWAYVRAGNYLVRYAGDEHFRPSADTLVTLTENLTASVTFDSKGGTEIAPVKDLRYGDTVPKPENPRKDGCAFDGWYEREDYEFGEYDFSAIITEPVEKILYAKWKVIIPGTTEEETDEINSDVGNKDLISVNKVVDKDETVTTVKVSDNVISEVKTTSDNKVTVNSGIWVGGLKDSYTYTGEAVRPEIHVYDGVKKLVEKQDYTLSYKNNKSAAGRDSGNAPAVAIRFKGNYDGNPSQNIKFTISAAELGKDIIAGNVGVEVKKNDKVQKPAPDILWSVSGKPIASKTFELTYKDMSGNEVPGVTKAGTYTVEIAPKEKDANYTGILSANIIAVGDEGGALSKAKANIRPGKYLYTGKPILPKIDEISVSLGNKALEYGKDYVIDSVHNNIEPGKAVVVFKGTGTINGEGKVSGYCGTKTATFTIKTGRIISNTAGSSFVFTYPGKVSFIASGAKPVLKVFDSTVLLKEGVDYSVSYKNNKNTAANGPVIVVKGKGKYKGSVELPFEIEAQDIGKLTVTASDQFVAKEKYKKPDIDITDPDGKKLGKKDYAIKEDKEVVNETGVLHVVTITGAGDNYTGEATAEFRLMDKKADISKTGSFNISDQIYTGQPVTLGNNDLLNKLYTGTKKAPEYLVLNRDFEITGYKDNLKCGTAQVTVRGKGAWAGTKTLKFKIKRNKYEYLGALLNGVFVK